MSVMKIKGSDGQWHDIRTIRGEGVPAINPGDNGKVLGVKNGESQWVIPDHAHHYTVRWNQQTAQMTRMNDAQGITLDTTDFCYQGSEKELHNPFDTIYPWSGRKLCNVDIPTYMNLTDNNRLIDCVSAWEDDPDFSYDDEYGVWVYTPEFWGKSWFETIAGVEYQFFDVADAPVESYIHYPERIEGRWHGVKKTINNVTVLLPVEGIPSVNETITDHLRYLHNYNASADTIFSFDANKLLYIVEFANHNISGKLGNGVCDSYTSSSDDQGNPRFTNFNTDTPDTITLTTPSGYASRINIGSILVLGSTEATSNVGHYYVTSMEKQTAGGITNTTVTVDREIVVPEDVLLTENKIYWQVRGVANLIVDGIGSQSGNLLNDRYYQICQAYYRGQVIYGNFMFDILGVKKEYTDGRHKIYISSSDAEADSQIVNNYTGIDIIYDSHQRYISEFGKVPTLATPFFATGIGGTSSDPVGDGIMNSEQINSAMAYGGYFALGGTPEGNSSGGIYYQNYVVGAGGKGGSYSIRPCLRLPRYRGQYNENNNL